MDRFEEAVMDYISATPDCFLKTQLSLPWDKELKIGGSLPDFVVLDFRESTVYVVEVTTASSLKSILTKVDERQTRWYEPIRKYKSSWTALVKDWDFRVCLFLREQVVGEALSKTSNFDDVSVISLDKVLTPWDWERGPENTVINPLR